MQMTRYYFDTRDNQSLIADEIGIEFPTFDDVKAEASIALADLAKDVLPGSEVRDLAIEVRDEIGLVSIAKLRFEIEHISKH